MSDDKSSTPKKGAPAPLRDDQIVTKRSVGRRAFLGIMTAGSVVVIDLTFNPVPKGFPFFSSQLW